MGENGYRGVLGKVEENFYTRYPSGITKTSPACKMAKHRLIDFLLILQCNLQISLILLMSSILP